MYEVESESLTMYFLRGIAKPGGFRKSRFVPFTDMSGVTVGTKLKCHNAVDSDGYLQPGIIYTVAELSRSHDEYRLVGIKSWWGQYRFHVVDETGQPPPIVNVCNVTKATMLPILDANKASELRFFQARTHSNECPCGSTRGVCPDHPV